MRRQCCLPYHPAQLLYQVHTDSFEIHHLYHGSGLLYWNLLSLGNTMNLACTIINFAHMVAVLVKAWWDGLFVQMVFHLRFKVSAGQSMW